MRMRGRGRERQGGEETEREKEKDEEKVRESKGETEKQSKKEVEGEEEVGRYSREHRGCVLEKGLMEREVERVKNRGYIGRRKMRKRKGGRKVVLENGEREDRGVREGEVKGSQVGESKEREVQLSAQYLPVTQLIAIIAVKGMTSWLHVCWP